MTRGSLGVKSFIVVRSYSISFVLRSRHEEIKKMWNVCSRLGYLRAKSEEGTNKRFWILRHLRTTDERDECRMDKREAPQRRCHRYHSKYFVISPGPCHPVWTLKWKPFALPP